MAKKHHEEDAEARAEKRAAEEKAKISTPEIIIFSLLCLGADIFELLASLAAAVPILGWVAWGFAVLIGAMVSAAVIVWSFMRGMHGQAAAKRAVTRSGINIAGEFFDLTTLAFLPVRTVAFLLSVFINNYLLPAAEKAGGFGKYAKSFIDRA